VEKRAVLRENLSCQPMQRALLLLYKGYLEQDYSIKLGETTIKKIMALNRRLHLAPQRPAVVVEVRDPREGPKKSRCPFEHLFVDFRYLDAKPGGVQLYSTLLLEGFSRTILAGSLTPQQNAGVLLHVYFQALLSWGLWEEVISDHGGQFIDRDWISVNERLGIRHEMYEKRRPWLNLIESHFGIQARLGECTAGIKSVTTFSLKGHPADLLAPVLTSNHICHIIAHIDELWKLNYGKIPKTTASRNAAGDSGDADSQIPGAQC
jgi:transposase InsO family protein